LLWCFNFAQLNAQDTEAKALQGYSAFISKLVVPPSPEAASLGKYGNNDINYATGAMSLSIPITSIGGREIQLPIGLSYDGSGNRVEQIPSMVGLGWALSSGGVITRSAKGNPDMAFNYFNKASDINQTTLGDPFAEQDHLYDITKGLIETQPDEYFFNFGGMSGKFYISPYKQVYMRKQQDLSIQPSITNDVDNFVIVDSRGNKYYFSDVETTYLLLDDSYGIIPATSRAYNYKSSWFLTKVESANGTETIDLTYDTEATAYTASVNSYQYQSISYTQCGTNAPISESSSNGGINIVQINNRRFIKTIAYKLGTDVIQTIKFETAASTLPFATGRQLNLIKVYNATEGSMAANQFAFLYDGSTNRLTLKSVQEQSINAPSLTKNPHTFVYNTAIQLPIPISNSIDHWGYFNASGNSSSLIPSYTVGCNGTTYTGGSADRETNPTYVQAGIMTRINYPTGGYTAFEYEAHKVPSANPCTPTSEDYAGGLRLKSSKNYELNGTLLTNKTYNYVKEGSTGTSGQLTNGISYASTSSSTTYVGQCFGSGCGFQQDVTCNVLSLSTSNHTSLGADDGSHINYSRVEEVNPTIGKTVYNYFGEDLIKKEVYTEGGVLVAETLYEYTSDNRTKALFGYTPTANQDQDNRTQFVLGANSLYFWKMQSNDIRLYLNAAPYTPYQKSKIYPTKFTRSGYLRFSDWKQQSKVTEKQYFNGDLGSPLTTITSFVFENKNITQPTQVVTANSTNITHKTKTYFSHDLQTDAAHPLAATMVTKNMIGIPLRTELYTNTLITNAQEMVYATFATNQILPKYINSRLRNGVWETQFTVNAYNAVGLPTQTTAKGFGVSTNYTWTKHLLKTKVYGNAAPNQLTWAFAYNETTNNLLNKSTDENGLVKTFAYDNLLRLLTVKDRVQSDGVTDPQATITYDYHYKNLTTVSATDFNYVGTSTSFKGITIPLSTKQYVDGLGRPIEVVKENYTPAGKQQKNYMTYDALGRQSQTFLPFESNSLGFETTTVAPVTTEYEASPLSRPIKQTNVDGTVVQTSYSTNSASDAIRIFTAPSEGVVTSTTTYGGNQLSITTMIDENTHITKVYTDKLGRVVLTRKSLSGTNVDTYNVYDDYGKLVAVLPPGSVDASGNVTYSLIFQYTYDNKNRLVQKKVPGADAQKFYYDSRDLLILTQDGNMRAENATKHLGTIYDNLGRVIKTGFALVSPTQGVDFTLTDAQITDSLTSTLYYANKSWVAHQGVKVLKPTNTSTLRNYIWSYIERRDGYTYTGNPVWTAKQHLMSKTFNSTANAVIPYDRPIDDYDYAGVDWSVNGYDGAQKPTLNVRYCFTGNAAQEVRTYSTFEYDNGQRLTNTKYMYTLNAVGVSVPTDILSNAVYNFKDQLIEKNIGHKLSHGKYLQSVDYAYNLRGWLTSINSGFLPSALDYPLFSTSTPSTVAANYASLATTGYLTPPVNSSETNPDLFKETLQYANPNTYGGSVTSVAGQYNGNISQVEWQVAGREAQSYSLFYDDLDRLTDAKYADLHSPGWGGRGWAQSSEGDWKYNETATYDLRGNILSLNRGGLVSNTVISAGTQTLLAGYFSTIDNLTYTYGDSNRLKKVTDASIWAGKGFIYANSGNARDYEYDKNGNLTADRNKGITNITYNYLNLPMVITFTGNRIITFVYDASGAKLRKIVNNNGVTDTYDYVNGVEYKNSVLQRIAHTEGSVTLQSDGITYMHEYVLRDHLGSARVTFKDIGNDGLITDVKTEITQINSFYPFGMNMESNTNGAAGKNKYQYTGKELNDDFALNWNDYGARFYDASIGRWTAIDPLAVFYSTTTPYAYVMNMPTIATDPNGMACAGCGKSQFDPNNNHTGLSQGELGQYRGTERTNDWRYSQGGPARTDPDLPKTTEGTDPGKGVSVIISYPTMSNTADQTSSYVNGLAGHAALNVDGTVYSFEGNGKWSTYKYNDYIDFEHKNRHTTEISLDVDKNKIIKALDERKNGLYDVSTNSCVTQTMLILTKAGIKFNATNGAVSPLQLESALFYTGNFAGVSTYQPPFDKSGLGRILYTLITQTARVFNSQTVMGTKINTNKLTKN
jgi:RHS repeat-associated protein